MLSVARDHVLALASLRHDLPAVHARGVDLLPAEVTRPLEDALVGSLDEGVLGRALRVVVERLMLESREADPGLAECLAVPLTELAR